jgi:protocatechuate 3,4-dioxygenase beta subunit
MERRITRREALGVAGTAGAALLASRGALNALGGLVAATPATAATTAGNVAVTPTMTEGPYWIDEMLRRFDVRASTGSSTSQAGVPLALKINVLDAATGGAINNAHVDIWHANASGLYSDEGGQPGGTSTAGQNFLRGYQVTGVDAGAAAAPVDGQVNFATIWPGWYQGRAIHIHVRVRTYDGSAVATNYTTQIFFSDADNATVMNGAAPYNSRSPRTDPTTDETDMILGSSKSTNVVPVTGSVADGFAATFTIGLTGVASNVTDTEKLTASITSVWVTKNRAVAISVKTNGAATAHATLVRDGKTLAKATGQLTAGTHSLRMTLGKTVGAGPATLKLVLASNGDTLTRTRKLTVPA